MAFDFIRMVPEVRFDQTAFDGVDGTTIYGTKYVAEDNSKTVWHLWGAGVPNTTYLADVEVDSLYTDTTNHVLYIKTTSTVWTVVGAQS